MNIKEAALSFGATRKLLETAHNLTDVLRKPHEIQKVLGHGSAGAAGQAILPGMVEKIKRPTVVLPKGTSGHVLAHELGHIMDPALPAAQQEISKMPRGIFGLSPEDAKRTSTLLMTTETAANRNALKLLKQLGTTTKDRTEFVERMKFPFSTYRQQYAQVNGLQILPKSFNHEKIQTHLKNADEPLGRALGGLHTLEAMRQSPRLVAKFVPELKSVPKHVFNSTKDVAPTPFVFKPKE